MRCDATVSLEKIDKKNKLINEERSREREMAVYLSASAALFIWHVISYNPDRFGLNRTSSIIPSLQTHHKVIRLFNSLGKKKEKKRKDGWMDGWMVHTIILYRSLAPVPV